MHHMAPPGVAHAARSHGREPWGPCGAGAGGRARCVSRCHLRSCTFTWAILGDRCACQRVGQQGPQRCRRCNRDPSARASARCPSREVVEQAVEWCAAGCARVKCARHTCRGVKHVGLLEHAVRHTVSSLDTCLRNFTAAGFRVFVDGYRQALGFNFRGALRGARAVFTAATQQAGLSGSTRLRNTGEASQSSPRRCAPSPLPPPLRPSHACPRASRTGVDAA